MKILNFCPEMGSMRSLFYGISTSILLFHQSVLGKNLYPLDVYESLFKDWMAQYSVTIPETDYHMRLQIFAETHDLIEIHNSG